MNSEEKRAGAGGETGVPPSPQAAGSTGNAPPPGTYPGQGAPPAVADLPAAPPPQKAKGRRVGTITMALSLIVFGGILLLRVFAPQVDYLFIARLAPVILVVLGAEILVAGLRHKTEKLRYDVLSVFVCLILICGSLAATVIPQLITDSIEGDRVNNRLGVELEDEAGTALRASGLPVTGIDVYINVRSGGFSSAMALKDLQAVHYVQARVELGKYDYASPEDFARDCRRITDVLLTVVPHLDYINFYTGEQYGTTHFSQTYGLWLNNRFQVEGTAQDYAGRVETEYWFEEGGYYISEWEHLDRLENPQDYGDGLEPDGDETDFYDADLQAPDTGDEPSPDDVSTLPPEGTDAGQGE